MPRLQLKYSLLPLPLHPIPAASYLYVSMGNISSPIHPPVKSQSLTQSLTSLKKRKCFFFLSIIK